MRGRGLNFKQPQLKFKRYHKQPMKKIEYSDSSTKLHHGFYGLRALQHGYINPLQLEIIRRFIVRTVGKRKYRKRPRF